MKPAKPSHHDLQQRKRIQACAILMAALAGAAYSQSNDLGRALDIFNKIQRATQNATQNAPKPAPAPSPASAPSPAPSSAPASAPAASPTQARQPAPSASPRRGNTEPPPGQYEITWHTKSKLAPGERIEHDPRALPKYDRRWAASHENFVPPEATTKYADGPRTLVMEIQPSHSTFGDGQALRYKRVLSNPYIPTERVDVPNPNWVISPYYAQGFFSSIEAFSCRSDGSLYVQGKVGVAADYLHGSDNWSRGIWRVEPDGKIVPFEVFPDSRYISGGKHTCTPRTCGLPSYPPRDRAWAAGSKDWVQDKHGNVWGIADDEGKGATPKACFVKRFNADGSETVIQSHQDLCFVPKGYNYEFYSPPLSIAYDEARDEVVFVAGQHGGNSAGSWALFKANQAGEVTELLRNWQHSDLGWYGPNPPGKSRQKTNQVNERWFGISDLVYDPHRLAVTFETSIFQAPLGSDWRRMYEIKGAFNTLKRLPLSPLPAYYSKEVFGKSATRLPSGAPGPAPFAGDDQLIIFDGDENAPSVFNSSCFDGAGNRFFLNGISIRKMDPQGRLSTWVK